MASLTEFCSLKLTLDFQMIGKVPAGLRLDVPFSGTATSSHWEGERTVAGVDHVTIGAGGVQNLDIQGRIGSGDDVVAYRAIGRGNADGPKELLVFETANEELGWLNEAVAVAVGAIDGNQLALTISVIET